MSCRIGNHVTRSSSACSVVARLARHGHLPVVEAVVGPVRQHEQEPAPAARTPPGRRASRRPARRDTAVAPPAGHAARRATASSPSAATKKAADALVKNASSAQAAASQPQAGARLRPDVAVPGRHHERDHRRFHRRGPVVHHVDVVGREQRPGDDAGVAPADPARRPARAAAPRRTPASSETSRACRTPTPNSSKATYSRPVNTGATYIGFHSSSDQAPNSALLRALWTHAPSSCQTTPTEGFHGGSAAGKTSAEPQRDDRNQQQQRDVAGRATARRASRSRWPGPAYPQRRSRQGLGARS